MNRVNEKWVEFNNRETLFNQLCLLGLYYEFHQKEKKEKKNRFNLVAHFVAGLQLG